MSAPTALCGTRGTAGVPRRQTWRLTPQSVCDAAAILRGRHTKTATEAAIEIRGLVETAGISDIADLQPIVTLIAKHVARLLEPQLGDAFGKARSGFLQQFLDVARR